MRERSGVPRFPVLVETLNADTTAAASRRVAASVAQQCRTRGRALTTDEAVALACMGPGAAERLTPRQREVATLVAGGLSNREVADRLQLSVRTVETHVANVLGELGLHSRLRLTEWAGEAGLVP